MKPCVVLDWDGVIFDDDAYKVALFECLSNFGIDETTAQKLYEVSKDKNGFNDKRLAERAAETASLEHHVVLEAVDSVMARTATHFIYVDARRFLEDTKSRYDVIVLTAGDDRIQRAKITASGLDEYIDRVIVVPADSTEFNKSNELTALTNEGRLIAFYDDRLSTIVHLHESLRDAQHFLPIYVKRSMPSPQGGTDALTVSRLDAQALEHHMSLLGTPRTLISAVRLSQNNQILLVEESAGRSKGLWTLPIGHVESDQSFIEAAIREVKEETGYDISVSGIHSITGVDGTAYGGSDFDLDRLIVIVCFDGNILGGPVSNPELLPKWHSLTDTTLAVRGEAWQRSLWI